MAGGGLEGTHEGLVLLLEQRHGLPQLGFRGQFQVRGPLPGLALDGADPLPELRVGLGVRPQPLYLRPQGLESLQLLPGLGLPAQVLPQAVPLRRQLLHLGLPGGMLLLQGGQLFLQAVHFLLQGLLCLCDPFNILDNILLVEAAECHCLNGILIHGAHHFPNTILSHYIIPAVFLQGPKK